MRLIFMGIIPASGNRLSCLGPVFRPFTDSDHHSFHKLLCHIDVPSFSWQNKVIKVCPKYLLSFYQKAQIKSNDVHNYPGSSTKVAEFFLFVRLFKVAHDLTSWPSG